MGEVLNKIVDGVKRAPEAVKNHVKKHIVIYEVITALFLATLFFTEVALFLTGVGGSFALIGGHAAWAPHFMSAMNTAISGAWSGLSYAMTAAGGVGGAGLLGTAIMSIISVHKTPAGSGFTNKQRDQFLKWEKKIAENEKKLAELDTHLTQNI
ncbi:MAG: hypothetical protein KDK55_02205 [Chlamydiia bacterium]|nr:hypothetical protein [Chlamydiia bacterium]